MNQDASHIELPPPRRSEPYQPSFRLTWLLWLFAVLLGGATYRTGAV